MSPLSIVLNVSRLFSRHVCQIYTSAGYMGNSVCFDDGEPQQQTCNLDKMCNLKKELFFL